MTRRALAGSLALLGGAAFGATALRAAPAKLDPRNVSKEADVACLYHCDFGDEQRFSQMLTNMNNHLSAYDFDPMRLKLVIVAHGAGIKFFLADRTGTPWEKDRIDPDIYKRFVGLTKFEVEAYLCEITFKRQKIDQAKTHDAPFLKFVPSGVATVGELQGKGFAYLKVG